jgi:hypothetical protein
MAHLLSVNNRYYNSARIVRQDRSSESLVSMLRNTAERASRTRAADPGGHGVEVGWESQIRAQRATTKKRRRYGLCPSLTKRGYSREA